MTTIYTNKGRDSHSYPDTGYPPTSMGSARQAQDLKGCSKASLVDGDLTWSAPHGGSWGNKVLISHTQGASCPVSRPLAITASLDEETVTVIWGTDGSGTPVAPTPAEIVAEAAGVPGLGLLANPASGGAEPTTELSGNLAGGVDDGDWLRCGRYVTCINSVV